MMMMRNVSRYLTIRRALGYDLDRTEQLLRSFADFVSSTDDTHIVNKTAVEWASLSTTPRERQKRLKVIVRFACFLKAEDSDHEIPSYEIQFRKCHRPVPYILTDKEIELIITEAARLGPKDSLRPHTYKTIFGLLSVSGMRVSEVLSLRINDIKADGLVIRNTKFQKNRLIPIHDSTSAELENYLNLRKCIPTNDNHLFISLHKRKLSYGIVIQTFHQICKRVGLPLQGGSTSIRLHDLRHTFAVKVLQKSPDKRDHVTQNMLALTTYMGHANIKSNYWYLESTPQLMCDIADACEDFIQGVLL